MGYDWYWAKGIHDGVIKNIYSKLLQYDYTDKKPVRNYLEILIDTTNALFDTSIKAIRFYNYKVLNDFEGLQGYWWIKDELTKINDKFKIKIFLGSSKGQQILEIIFEFAKLIR